VKNAKNKYLNSKYMKFAGERSVFSGEARERGRKTGVEKLIDDAKKRAQELIDEFLDNFDFEAEDKDIEDYQGRIQKSMTLGEEVRGFILYLFEKKGIDVGDKFMERKESDLESRLRTMLEIDQEGGREAVRTYLKDEIEPEDLPYAIIAEDDELYFGRKRTTGRLVSANNQIFIQEDFSAGIFKNDTNRYFGNLFFISGEESILDCKYLLPPGHLLIPGNILNKDFQPENYMGLGHGGVFGAGDNRGVYYGDLLVDGGALSLLHEIGHAWMQEIEDRGGVESEMQQLHQLISFLIAYGERQEEMEAELTRINSAELKEMQEEHLRSRLNSFKEEFEDSCGKVAELIDKFEPMGYLDIENGEVVLIRSLYEDREISFSKKALIELLGQSAQIERDAWAIAVRVLRYLRKRGIDIDPALEEFRDLKHVIYGEGLDTYQYYWETLLRGDGRELVQYAKKPLTFPKNK